MIESRFGIFIALSGLSGHALIVLGVVILAGFLVGSVPAYRLYWRTAVDPHLNLKNQARREPMDLHFSRILPLFLVAMLLIGCSEDAGSQVSEGHENNAGELTAEELAAEPDTAARSRPQVPNSDAKPGADSVVELQWDALIPAEWQPDKIMAEYNADTLQDDDPRAQELWDKLQLLWKEAPVVESLDGKRVKLPGFVVPLDWDAKKIGEFLLVPYYGACIHVPPPPANQTIHVITAKGREYTGKLFDTVWVTGTLRVVRYLGEMADAGYRLEATAVEPYE